MPGFGKVTAQLSTFIVDSTDPDSLPDLVPLQGTITFTPNVSRIIDSIIPQPMILGSSPITGVLDDEGFLSTPGVGNAIQYQGLWLPATDNAEFNPDTFQYLVTFNLKTSDGRVVTIPSQYMELPTDATVDLANVVPAENAPAQSIAAAEASAAAAAASSQETVVLGTVTNDHLILTRRDGVEIDAGNVRGAKGDTGAKGDIGDTTPSNPASAPTTITIPGTATTVIRTLTGATVAIGLQTATPSSGTSFTVTLVLKQDATGSRLVTWPATMKWMYGLKPVLSTAPNAIDVIHALWTGAEWIGLVAAQAAA